MSSTATTPIRTLIVDDEPLARKRLRTLLAHHPRLAIVGEAENGEEACQAIDTLRPDLVLLDIQMPGMSGFDVLATLSRREPQQQPEAPRPRIIFITAHDEFAVKAFEEQALDYLLKPVEPERLARALARLDQPEANIDRLLATIGQLGQLGQLGQAGQLGPFNQTKPLLRRIPVRRGPRIALVDVSSAAFFRAEDKYTVLYTADADHVIDRTIDELEQSLDPEQFLRIHRAAIVNVSFVHELTAVEGGRFLVSLTDTRNTRLYASRTGAKTLRDRLGL